MAHWLVQGNPAKWRVHEFFAHGNQLDSWSITRYRDQIQQGDDVALWLAGRDAGVVALGTVTGAVEDVGRDPDPYWVRREDADAVRMRMPLRLTEVFLDDPITREELRHDPGFAGAAILQQPFAGNPFPLTDDQWAAIVAHRHSASTEERTTVPWTLRPGDRIRRTELHGHYGGSGQSGISPSRTTSNILVFTDPRSGERHGYFDHWAADDSFHYTGEGQRGDQTMTKGNLAILNHRADGRALRVFQGATGTVQYVGQFVLDELEPYTVITAPSTGGGPQRQVIRFHLLPIDRAVTASKGDQLGRPYRRRDEIIEVTSREVVTARDPDAAGRGLRAHHRMQNRLSDLVEGAGYSPIDAEPPIDPAFDLAWFDGQTLFVVEVKSCTPDNQTQQLRLGIGQVLDYEDTLLACGHAVQPVLYLEEQPADPRWSGLAQRHGIQLLWPGTEHRLLNPNAGSAPSVTAGVGGVMDVRDIVDGLVRPARLWSRGEVLARPSPVPNHPGVYGWYFSELPWPMDTSQCVTWDGCTLLYGGIAPKAPPANGRPASQQTLRNRIRYHYTGNAAGSTLRLTLGCLLAERLGIQLRRVGGGRRLTFAAGESRLSAWMADNAYVTWVETERPWLAEQHFIASVSLPLNLDQNRHHAFHEQLTKARADARRTARMLPVLST